MAKTSSMEDQLALKDAGKTISPGDMCLLFLPRPVFEGLSKAAEQRGMTLAQFLSAAVDSFMATSKTPKPVARGSAIDENVASFHFTPVPDETEQVVGPGNRPRLRGFR